MAPAIEVLGFKDGVGVDEPIPLNPPAIKPPDALSAPSVCNSSGGISAKKLLGKKAVVEPNKVRCNAEVR
jgi:hypothetical protein